LRLWVHSFSAAVGVSFPSHHGFPVVGVRCRLPVPPTTEPKASLADVEAYLRYWETNRHSVDWEIDGTVVKVDRTDEQRAARGHPRTPPGRRCVQFPPEERTALLKAIDVHTGRTGKSPRSPSSIPCS
jgi:DNA ligase (NAD+)